MIKQLIKTTILTAAFVFPVAGVNLAGAQSAEGQIEGGNIYRVRNLTDGGAFVDTASADKCETVQFRVRIHNPGPNPLSQVHVKANIVPGSTAATTHVSTVTVSSQNADPSNVSDTASVNISTSQKLTYVAGSSELLDNNTNFLSGIGNVTEGVGVNIGNVGVSIGQMRFVQFKAQVDCPQPCVDNPNTPGNECNPCVDNPNTPGNECNPCVDNPNMPGDDCAPCVNNPNTSVDECNPAKPGVPTSLPETGIGGIAAIFAAVTSFSSLAYYAVVRKFASV